MQTYKTKFSLLYLTNILLSFNLRFNKFFRQKTLKSFYSTTFYN